MYVFVGPYGPLSRWLDTFLMYSSYLFHIAVERKSLTGYRLLRVGDAGGCTAGRDMRIVCRAADAMAASDDDDDMEKVDSIPYSISSDEQEAAADMWMCNIGLK